MTTDISGTVRGFPVVELREFLTTLDLAPGSDIRIQRNNGQLKIQTNYRIAAQLAQRIRNFVHTR